MMDASIKKRDGGDRGSASQDRTRGTRVGRPTMGSVSVWLSGPPFVSSQITSNLLNIQIPLRRMTTINTDLEVPAA
jgi:hypothetical protein